MNGYIKIFLLEDNEVYLNTVTEMLDMWGVKNYHAFTSHHEFMNKFEEVDIVILDHTLKEGMTGLEMIERIYKRNWNCYIIVLSGSSDGEIILNYLNKGADKYVLKGSNEVRELKQFIFEGIDKMLQFRELKRIAHGDNRASY